MFYEVIFLKTIKGGDDTTTTTDVEEDIDRGGGRPKTNGNG
ncbi:hypothetical protein [Flavobacterium sp. J27]|nr:hypothetical protein [Flavobacterium sp. J27]